MDRTVKKTEESGGSRQKRTRAPAALRRWVARRINAGLSHAGLRLDYFQRDFDDRPVDEFTTRRLCSAMADEFDRWVTRQKIFEVAETFDTAVVTEQFLTTWLTLPFRDQHGGSRFNNLLWLFLIAKSYGPSVIIDSGTYRGASAWALSRGCPNAHVYSFDVDLSQLRFRSPSVDYLQMDWSEGPLDFSKFACGDRILAYFDDHVDQVRRLLEASERGCRIAIFDDDFPVTSFFSMAPSASVLPKIEFALDSELKEGQVLQWSSRGSLQTWEVDREYLERGLSKISATERLPNSSLISGIHQTPYRIVSLKVDHDK